MIVRQEEQANMNNPKNNALVTNVNSRHLEMGNERNKYNLYPLQKVKIYVGNTEIEAIVDSGTQVSILNKSLIPDLKVEAKGKIILESAFR